MDVLKAEEEDRYLLMVAYSPNRMPARGADRHVDVVAPRALEKAAWKFMQNGARVGLFHEPGHDDAARVVESWIHRGPKWKLTGPDGSTQTIRKGDWLVGLILSPEAWSMYRQGLIKGASPQGSAVRKPASASTLARQRKR